MKTFQDPIRFGVAWSNILVKNVQMLKKGVELDLTEFGSIVRLNFFDIWCCGKDAQNCCLYTFSAFCKDGLCPGVLGGKAYTCHDSDVSL